MIVAEASSQIKGEPPSEPIFNPDTVFIFESPRPLINAKLNPENMDNAWGIDLILSNNGFGGGLFWQQNINKDLLTFASIYFSGARNTDEFDYRYFDPYTGTIEYRVPNKVNRLFMFPLMFGLQNYLFTETLTDSFRPYFLAGLGPTFILSTPYEREFFNSFGYADFFIRFGAMLGLGSEVSGVGNTIISVNLRYYYIPFGGDGLQSILNNPIKDFGGIFLSISIGMKY